MIDEVRARFDPGGWVTRFVAVVSIDYIRAEVEGYVEIGGNAVRVVGVSNIRLNEAATVMAYLSVVEAGLIRLAVRAAQAAEEAESDKA